MVSATEERKITKHLIIKATIDSVWEAWTSSDRVMKWFAPKAIVDAKEGGAFELYFMPGNIEVMNTKGCTILNIEHEKELQFTWKGPDQFASFMNADDELTIVTVT
jgi:uncharacterized protein YndB with AHSA1/START domain